MERITEHEIRLTDLEHEKLTKLRQKHKHGIGNIIILRIKSPPDSISMINYWLLTILQVQAKPVKEYDLSFIKQFIKEE